MNELLQTSLIWRLCAAIAAWFRTTALSRGIAAVGRLWRESGLYRFWARLLTAPSVTERSSYAGLLTRFNAALYRFGSQHLMPAGRSSLACRIYGAVLSYLRGSFFLGWLFAGGMTSVLLFIIAAYFPVDWLLRDVLQLTALSSVWDEALMAFCFLWVLYRRAASAKPLRSAANTLDVWFGFYLLAGLVLLYYTVSHLGINITGYRASMQYILLFYLVTRLIRDDADFKMMYCVMIAGATVFALHGLYQFVVGAEIPSTWTDQAETAVRTRAFSVFSNPNIFGAYMLLFAPMAIGAAYAAPTPAQKVLFWGCGIAMCAACLVTMSRGAWLALAIAAVLFALVIDRRLLALMLIGGIAACFLPFVRSRITYLFTPEFAESNARGGRAKRWETALGYLDDYGAWRCGLGYGIFGGAVAAQNPINPALDYMYVDNYYVKILVENGIAGLTSFLMTLAALLWNGLRACGRASKTPYKPLCMGMLAGLIGILVHSFFESLWEEPYMMALFFAVAGMMIYAGFLRKKEETA